MPSYDYRCVNCGVIEIFHGILEDDQVVCPKCELSGLKKLISSGGGIIMAGREANQYNEIRHAKYWRDKNGIKHKVGPGDGHTGSATIKKQTATSEEVKERLKRDARLGRQRRIKLQQDRANAFNKEQLKKL